jgi:hypothetical protein
VINQNWGESGYASNRGIGEACRSLSVAIVYNEYLQIDAEKWADRVRLKNESARKMAHLVITKKLSKDVLASQDHEGLIMALVSTIHASADEKDLGRISVVANRVKRLHIKYMIATALGRIFEQRLATNVVMPGFRL